MGVKDTSHSGKGSDTGQLPKHSSQQYQRYSQYDEARFAFQYQDRDDEIDGDLSNRTAKIGVRNLIQDRQRIQDMVQDVNHSQSKSKASHPTDLQHPAQNEIRKKRNGEVAEDMNGLRNQ